MGINILLLIFIISPMSILIHELGHGFIAKYFRANLISISLGVGQRLFLFTISNVQIVVHKVFFIGGQIVHNKYKSYSPVELIFIAVAGPLANLIFAYLSYVLYICFLKDIFLISMYYNIWLFIVNLIPIKMKNRRSDGWAILQIILDKKRPFL